MLNITNYEKVNDMILKLHYKLLPHPYIDEPSSVGEKWSWIKLDVVDEHQNLLANVIDTEWDILVFLQWFIENEEPLCIEETPFKGTSMSIAKDIYEFFEQLEDSDLGKQQTEVLFDAISDYRERHWIYYSLRGSKGASKAFIGSVNGESTISLFNNKDHWAFNIKIKNFFLRVHEIYNEITPQV